MKRVSLLFQSCDEFGLHSSEHMSVAVFQVVEESGFEPDKESTEQYSWRKGDIIRVPISYRREPMEPRPISTNGREQMRTGKSLARCLFS